MKVGGWYSRLLSAERRCLAVISAASRTGSGTDVVAISYRDIEKLTGLSPRHIKSGLDGLEMLGLMTRVGKMKLENGGRSRAHYRLTGDGKAFVERYTAPLRRLMDAA
jgi:hypothetical protein